MSIVACGKWGCSGLGPPETSSQGVDDSESRSHESPEGPKRPSPPEKHAIRQVAHVSIHKATRLDFSLEKGAV